MTHRLLLALLILVLAGCGDGGAQRDSAPPGYPDFSHVPDAVPRVEPYRRANMRPYTVAGHTYRPLHSAVGYRERGIASWYGNKFHGRRTASGERYDMYAMTAAHRTLPLPSYVRVTNLENGRSVVVRVNDRGPFHDNRIIDLSYAAASKTGMLGKGTSLVEVTAIDPRHPEHSTRHPNGAPDHTPHIYIQVGAFGVRRNAEHLATRLSQLLQHEVRIQHSTSRHGQVHRVQIGPLTSIEIADQVTATLERLHIHDSRIQIR